MAESNLPYTFGNVAGKIFPLMFQDSKIAKDFKCSRQKVSYVVSDGLGPYFKNELITEIVKNKCFYSVQLDETPINEKRVQQMDILIRFYGEKEQKVLNQHLASYHLGQATAQILLEHLQDSLTELPIDYLLNVFSDGPNVMKSLQKMMKHVNPDLLDIGTCSLHKVHNTFAKGLNVFGGDVETFLVDLYYFFKNSAVRSAAFKELQIQFGVPEHIFVRHLSSRWLTLRSSVGRFIEQYVVLKQFFSKNFDSKYESVRLRRISQTMNDKALLCKALFLQNVSELFTRFLKLFQRQEPLVHVLYDELVTLVKRIMGRFLKASTFNTLKGSKLADVDLEKGDNWLKQPELGTDTLKELATLSLSEQKSFILGVRSFYIACTKDMVRTLPLNNQFLEDLKCLHPVFRSEESSLRCIKRIASKLPNVVSPQEISLLVDEWVRLQNEDLKDIVLQTPCEDEKTNEEDEEENEEKSDKKIEIDDYWSSIFHITDLSGNKKYALIAKLVKALLCLAHGNADSERAFSTNKIMLENRSSLGIESINGLRSVKSHLQKVGGVDKVNVSTSLIKYVKGSRLRYEERKQKSSQKRKAVEKIENELENFKKLKTKDKELSEQLSLSQKLLDNASRSIDTGLKQKDFTIVESGQILFKEAKARIDETIKLIEENKLKMLDETKKKK